MLSLIVGGALEEVCLRGWPLCLLLEDKDVVSGLLLQCRACLLHALSRSLKLETHTQCFLF